jgi:hypothetical protein
MRPAGIGAALLAAGVLGLSAYPSAAGQAPVATSDTFTIVPGERFGPIRETTTRAALVSLFPPGTVRDADVALGEGFCAPERSCFPVRATRRS